MASNFLLTQNDPENIKLLRASSVAYKKAKRGENNISYFLMFLAIGFPICYFFLKDDNLKYFLFGGSFLLTILFQIFTSNFQGNTSKGAIFKEEFDAKVFNLPWKSTIIKIDRQEVLMFSNLYKGEEIKDWYSPNLSPSIEKNIAIAIFQHSNTSWDIELRKAFRYWLINFLIIYSIGLSFFSVYLKIDTLTLFLLLFSLLSFYTHFITLIRGHSRIISKREAISRHLDEIIQTKNIIGLNELRDIQDEIYSTRLEATKVPNFFFHLYKSRMNCVAEEYIMEVNNIYKK
jgi:hypothetical protein